MALVADIWVDLPELEGAPDRVSMAQLDIAIPTSRVPDAAWRAIVVQALRAWFHTVPARAWAQAEFDRSDRSGDGTPEIFVRERKKTAADVLARISPRQVDDDPRIIAAVRGRGQ